ncbi:hypothetical protein EDC62_0214 [Tibeticola sediminis]|uniref:Bacteriophage Rz lysis protein n=1 Tax=Tibeticola sediminis TaxID=1917811 RepID=A0A3N4UQL7_9BURK|nr:hypothetical protein [Tibeticola sediminis]RPE72523.1 hypothetical protein EDC62_0214 [Tibeticola sediminis]
MIPLPTVWIAAAALAAGAAGGYALASKVSASETAQAEARLARCEAGRAEDARAAAERTAALLARAQDADRAAAEKLAAQKAAFDKRLKEVRREIYSLSTGRECLSGALRLRLNRAIAGADDLPARPGGADPAAPEPADDTAVAQWIANAASAYDDCRARIDAIRHWDEVTHDGR